MRVSASIVTTTLSLVTTVDTLTEPFGFNRRRMRSSLQRRPPAPRMDGLRPGHSRRSAGHARQRDAVDLWSARHRSVNRLYRHVSLDDVAVDHSGVAAPRCLRNAHLLLYLLPYRSSGSSEHRSRFRPCTTPTRDSRCTSATCRRRSRLLLTRHSPRAMAPVLLGRRSSTQPQGGRRRSRRWRERHSSSCWKRRRSDVRRRWVTCHEIACRWALQDGSRTRSRR